MPKKHRRKSSTRRKERKSKRSRKQRKSKSRKSPHSHKKDRKRGSRHDDGRKKDHTSQHKKHDENRPPSMKKDPDMTNAAMNENLGNVVLVRNRGKTSRASETNTINPNRQKGPTPTNVTAARTLKARDQGAVRSDATAAQRLKAKDQGPRTTSITRYTPMPSSGTTTKREENMHGSGYPPSDVNMAPLSRTTPLSIARAPISSGTSGSTTTQAATTGSTTPLAATTTGTTTVGTTAATTSAPRPSSVSLEKTDELTRKEVDPEKSGSDKAQKWRAYMEKAIEGGSEAMQADFRLIRGYLPPIATRTAFDANMEKNRFEDVVCIDQTRVRLNCGSYIHASWVNISPTKKVILTQLPVRESGGEFWQMILELDVQAILLILTHAEYNMFHGNWAFPAEQDFLHFDRTHIRVGEFKRVVIDRDWTMHVICVRTGDIKRFIHMHHYSGWTHGKQPTRILDIWKIQSTFRKYAYPHVYMSLSGCGRAGTYAAFEIAHERLHSDSFIKVNINDCICRARNGRMHAVQRPIQMQTIHACIMEHIMATKFASQLSPKTVSKYEEYSTRFNKCAELQEDMP